MKTDSDNDFYNEWQNIVVCSHDCEYIKTKESRLNLALCDDDKVIIIFENTLILDDDKFEAMRIDCLGDVTIWTEKKVWMLVKQQEIERFIFLPRHPEFFPY